MTKFALFSFAFLWGRLFMFLSCTMFPELPVSVILYVSLILESSQTLILKLLLLLFFPSFSFWYSNHWHVTLFESVPQFLYVLSIFFFSVFNVFFLCTWEWKVSPGLFLSSLILFSTASFTTVCPVIEPRSLPQTPTACPVCSLPYLFPWNHDCSWVFSFCLYLIQPG